jgi:hypothetical protein
MASTCTRPEAIDRRVANEPWKETMMTEVTVDLTGKETGFDVVREDEDNWRMEVRQDAPDLEGRTLVLTLLLDRDAMTRLAGTMQMAVDIDRD